MKFIARFDLKNNSIKSDYRRFIVSFFKFCISNYSEGEFFEELYENGAQKKSLVWSVRLTRPVFKREVIKLGDERLDLIIRCQDKMTALVYFQSMLNAINRPFNIGLDNHMILRSIKNVEDKKIQGNIMGYKIFSPICIRLHDRVTNKDWYLIYKDENFIEEIKRKLKEELPTLADKIEEMEFDFSNCKKALVPVFGIVVPSTIGTFYVRGDVEVLNHIRERGLGSRKNNGFGLIEPIL